MKTLVTLSRNTNFNAKGLLRSCVLDAPNPAEIPQVCEDYLHMSGWVLSVKRPDSVRIVVRDQQQSLAFPLSVVRSDVARHYGDVLDEACGFHFHYDLKDAESILNVYINIDGEEMHWLTLAFADVPKVSKMPPVEAPPVEAPPVEALPVEAPSVVVQGAPNYGKRSAKKGSGRKY